MEPPMEPALAAMQAPPPEELTSETLLDKSTDSCIHTPQQQVSSFLNKPPLDPRVLRNVISSYAGETQQVAQCDEPVYHGHGQAVFKTGFTYTGVFHYGRMHGHGHIEWTSGVVYDGAFVDNEMQGHGTFTWPNGSSYTGDVVRGRRHGHGVFTTGTRGCVSLLPGAPDETQELLSQQQHQQIMPPLQFSYQDVESSDPIHAVSCARYEGQWQHGLPHGRGVLVFDDDQHVRFEGDFVNGKRHGKGEMRYASGNMYTGDWANDVKCGHGTMLWMGSPAGTASGGGGIATVVAVEKYDGAWQKDRPHGHGRHVWLAAAVSSGKQREKNWYEGQFCDGVRHGIGVFFYANGARYEGEWLDNAKHGKGAFYYEDGRVFVGSFHDDRAVESSNVSLSLNGGGGAESASGGGGGGGATTTTTSKILLYVDDLLPASATRDKARKLIEHAVLRLNTELRALYRLYLPQPPGPPVNNNTRASVSPVHHKAPLLDDAGEIHGGGGGGGGGGATLMEYYECRRLLADCGVKLSGGQLELLLQQLRQSQRRATIPHDLDDLPQVHVTDPVTLATSLPEVVPLERLLLYREFVELLVRLAHHQQLQQIQHNNGDDAASGELQSSLAETFTSFYEQLTRDRQRTAALSKTGDLAATTDSKSQLYAKELHSMYQKHHHAFQRLFVACFHRPSKAYEPEQQDNDDAEQDKEEERSPETVTIKQLLRKLQDLELVVARVTTTTTSSSPTTLFRVRHAMEALEIAFAVEQDRGVDPFFVETPLLFTDFLDALAILLLAKQQFVAAAHTQNQSQSQSPQQPHNTPLFALVDELAHTIPISL